MKIIWVRKDKLDTTLFMITQVMMIRLLSDMGHDIRLVTGYAKQKAGFGLGDRIQYLPAIPARMLFGLSFLLLAFLYVAREVLWRKLDVCIADIYTYWVCAPFAILSKWGLIRTRFVLDIRTLPVDCNGWHEEMQYAFYNGALRFSRRWFDGLTVVSEAIKRELVHDLGISQEKIAVFSAGVSISHFDPESSTAAPNMEINDRFVVMYHGELSLYRGLQNIVEAAQLLRQAGVAVVFVLFGRGPAKSVLRDLVKQHDLQEYVRILDAVAYEAVPSYLKICDVGILPFPNISWWRVSNPIKLREYLAMAKPVIITDIEAHRSLVQDLECGIYIPSPAPQHISQAICQLVAEKAETPERFRQRGLIGSRLMADKYPWEKQASNLEAFFTGIICNP